MVPNTFLLAIQAFFVFLTIFEVYNGNEDNTKTIYKSANTGSKKIS